MAALSSSTFAGKARRRDDRTTGRGAAASAPDVSVARPKTPNVRAPPDAADPYRSSDGAR